MKDTKVIILIGAPGSGKGTQSSLLKDYYNIVHISTGDLLRDEVKNKTPLGLKAESIMSKGILVDDEIITELLEQRIDQKDCESGFILDGYPRTFNQLLLLNNLLGKKNINNIKIIEIVISDEVVIKRISGRYTCVNCGAIYNKYFVNPIKEGVCDTCGSVNFKYRADDNEETVKNRLKIFKEQSKPILDYYYDIGVVKVDGLLKKEEVKNILTNLF
jgi:adenylate kinase